MADIRYRNVESDNQPRHLEGEQGFKAKWKAKPITWRRKVVAAAVLAIAIVLAVPLYAVAALVPGDSQVFHSEDKSATGNMTAQDGDPVLFYIYDTNYTDGWDTATIGTDTSYGMGSTSLANPSQPVSIDYDDILSKWSWITNPATFKVAGYYFANTWYYNDGDIDWDEVDAEWFDGGEELYGEWLYSGYNVRLKDGNTNVGQRTVVHWNGKIGTYGAESQTAGIFWLVDGAETKYSADKVGVWVDGEDGNFRYVPDSDVTFGAIVNPDNGDAVAIDPGNNSTIDLYPAFAVTFDANEGSGSGDTKYAVKDGDLYQTTAAAASAAGSRGDTYEFKGWTTADNKGKAWSDIDDDKRWATTDTITVTEATTLYAVWDEKAGSSVTYSYDINEFGQAKGAKLQFTSGDDQTKELTKSEKITPPTREANAKAIQAVDFDTTKYNVKWVPKAGGNAVSNTATYQPSRNGSNAYEGGQFTAVVSFDVTVDPGSGASIDSSYTFDGSGLTAATNVPLPTAGQVTGGPAGATLVGWKVGDSTTIQAPGDTVNGVDGNTTFTAVYKYVYTYSVDGNGSVSQARDEFDVVGGVPASITATPTSNSYKIDQWQIKNAGGNWEKIDAAGSNAIFTPTAPYASSEIRVKFVAKVGTSYNYTSSNATYGKIKFSNESDSELGNSKTDTIDDVSVAGSAKTIQVSYDSTKYNFEWQQKNGSTWTNPTSLGSTTTYTPSQTGSPAAYTGGDIRAYFTFNVSFDGNGGTIDESKFDTHAYEGKDTNQTVTLPTQSDFSSVPEGKTLAGWTSDGGSTVSAPGSSVSGVHGHTTFTAVWSYVNTYTVNNSDFGLVKLGESGTPAASVTDKHDSGAAATAYADYNSSDYNIIKWQKKDGSGAWTDFSDAGTNASYKPGDTTSGDYKIVYGFDIVYDFAEGGSLKVPATFVKSDQEAALASYTLPALSNVNLPEGKRLTGWTDGTNTYNLGTSGAAPAPISVSKNTTFAPVYIDTYTYTFQSSNASFGTVSPATAVTIDREEGTTATVTLLPAASAHNVIKWQYSADSGTSWADIDGTAGQTSLTVDGGDYASGTLFQALLGFDVTFNYNGGSLKVEDTFTKTDQTAAVTNLPLPGTNDVNAPSKKVLLGWSTDPTRTSANFDTSASTDYAPGDMVGSIDANTTFYAVWNSVYEIHYVVAPTDDIMGTVQVGSGTAAATADETVYDTTSPLGATAAAINPSTYYNFIGWTKNKAYGPGVTVIETSTTLPSAKVDKADGVTYYANFEHITTTVTYKPGAHGDFSNDVHTVNLGANTPSPSNSIMVASTSYTKAKGVPGYDFTGWDPAPDTSTAVTTAEEYTAQWTPKTGKMVNYSYPALSADEVAALGLPARTENLNWDSVISTTAEASSVSGGSYEGYTFGGWFTDQACTLPLSASATYGSVAGNDDNASSKTVYGKFTRGAANVTYYKNDDTGASTTQSGTTNTPLTLSATFTRTGFTFKGWTDDANKDKAWSEIDGGHKWSNGDTFTPPAGGASMYAVWQENTYTIKYNANGGTGTIDDQTGVKYTETVNLYSHDSVHGTFENSGKRFTGWKAGSTSYTETQSVSGLVSNNGGSITMYAQWETSYDVLYDTNGGTLTSSVPSATYYDTVQVAAGGTHAVKDFKSGDNYYIAKEGYTMTGWNTDANGAGTAYAPSESFAVNKNVTLYAQWSADPTSYIVERYVKSGSTYTKLSPDLSKSTYNGATVRTGQAIAAEASDTPTGYVRNDTPGEVTPAVVTSVASAGSSTNMSKLVLYFDPISYDVEYIYTGDTPSGVSKPAKSSYPYGSTVTIAAQPTNVTGFEFVPESDSASAANGWAISGVSLATAGDTSFSMPAGKVTLTGTWKRADFTVHYLNGDHGTVSAATETVPYEGSPSGSVTAVAESGYYPAGWDQVSSDGTTVIKSNVDPTSYKVENNDLYFKAKYAETVAYTYQPGSNPHSSFTQVGESKLSPVPASVKQLGTLLPAAVDAYGNPKPAAGYEFDKWQVTNDGDSSVGTSIPATISANYTFLATWKALTHDVTIACDEYTTVASGYTKDGASDNWVKNDPVATDASFTLPAADQITKPGYSLAGWVVSYTPVDEDGSALAPVEKTYNSPNATFNMPVVAITATPVWTADNITIKYVVDSEQGSLSETGDSNEKTEVVTAEYAATQGATAYAKDGYQFKAWVVDSGTDTATSLGSQTIQPVKQADGSYHAVTYRATFSKKTYPLTVESESAEKGTASASSVISVKYGETLTSADIAKITNTAKAHYLLADIQWEYTRYATNGTDVIDTGVAATNEQLKGIVFQGPVIIVAKYKGETVTVNYDANQGTGAPAGTTVEYGKSLTLSDGGDLHRDGYTFAGWDQGSAKPSGDADHAPSATIASFKPTSNEVTMYAHWDANTYKIQYSPNGYVNVSDGDPILVPADQNFLYGTASTRLSYMVPEVEGDPSLEFVGWDTNATKDGVRYAAGSLYPTTGELPAGDVTLYAVFKTKEFTVSYEPGVYGFNNTPVTGGSVASQTVTYGTENFSVAANGFSIEGADASDYEFDRWKGSDGSFYSASSTAHITGGLTDDFTLTAQWKPKANAKVYTLRFLKSDGSLDHTAKVNLSQPLQTNGVSLNGPAEAAPSANYAFDHWAVSTANSAAKITSNDTYTGLFTAAGLSAPPETLDLYPHYRVTSYTVNYDGNASSVPDTTVTGSVASQTFTYGATDGSAAASNNDFPANGFTAPGYTFLGWDEDETADSPDFEEYEGIYGDLVDEWGPDSLTLFAIWEANEYTVVYHNTDGSVLETKNSVKWGDVLPTLTGTPTTTESGVTHTGWSIDETPTSSSIPYTAGSDLFKTIAVADYGMSGSTLSDATTLDLYPVWSPEAGVFRVRFAAGEGTGTLSAPSIAGVEGGTGTVIANNLTRTGWTANGWVTDNGTPVADGYTWTFGTDGDNPANRDQTLTTAWKQNHYKVKYDANYDGAAAISTVTSVTWNSTGMLGSVVAPTRPGYTFAGWFDAPDDSGVEVTTATTYDTGKPTSYSGAVDSDGHEVTLYAHWTEKANVYTVQFVMNGGTYSGGSISDKTVSWTSNNLINDLDAANLSRAGYTAGDPAFYVDSAFTTPVTASTQYNELTGGVDTTPGKIYVKWVENDVVIKYETSDPEHGPITGVSSTTVKASTGTTVAPGEIGMIAEGYHIDGWYDKDDASQAIIPGSAGKTTFTPAKPGALWLAKTYVAKIEPDGDTEYTVKHHLQNLEDERMYTMTLEESGSGKTGTTATATNKTFPGFTYDSSVTGTKVSGTIAGNGSLVLKLYYTRNAYNLTYAYSWTGDSEPSSKPALPENKAAQKFESEQTAGAAPSLAGWDFNGWKTSPTDLDSDGVLQPGDEFEMPASNVVLTADMVRTTYDVKFAIDDDSASHATITGGPVAVPSDTKVSASAYDITPAAGWSVVEWKVVYDPGAGKTDTTTTAPEDYVVDAPLTFKAVLSEKVSINYATGDHGVFASAENQTAFKDVDPGTQFDSTYYYAGETDSTGPNAGYPKAQPGWKFTGWQWTQGGTTKDNMSYTDNPLSGGLDELVGQVKSNINFRAQWTATQQTLTINTGGATWTNAYTGVDASNAPVKGTSNAAVDTAYTDASYGLPTAYLSKPHYQLKEWRDKDNNVVSGSSFKMTGVDNTLTAVWEPIRHTVKYESNNTDMGTLDRYSENLQEVDNGTIQGSTPSVTVPDGYEFVNWTLNGSAPDPAVASIDGTTNKLTPVEPIDAWTFVANFAPLPQDVTFESDDDSKGTVTDGRDAGAKTALYNDTVKNFSNITATPLPGYKADPAGAWAYTMNKRGEILPTSSTTNNPAGVTILGPTVFKAKWVEKDDFTVTYETNEGSAVVKKEGVKWTDTDLANATTTRIGYDFKGWFLDAGFTTPAGGYKDGANPAFSVMATALNGGTVAEPTDGNITLYAKWDPKFGYRVNYNTNGGSNVSPTSAEWHSDTTNQLKDLYWNDKGFDSAMSVPTKVGYVFNKWYADAALTSEVTSNTAYSDLAGSNDRTSNIPTLYAGYTERPYTVKYNTGVSSIVVSDTTTNWFDPITFNKPAAREGWEFDGWYYGEGDGTKVVDGETRFRDLVNEVEPASYTTTVRAKWLKIVEYKTYQHKWQHSADGVIDYDGYNWSDYIGTPITAKATEGTVITIDPTATEWQFPGFAYFSQTDNLGTSQPPERLTGTLSTNEAENRFDIYYKERKDYTVTYDLNLGDDEYHKPMVSDDEGNPVDAVAPEAKTEQWWTDNGYYSAVDPEAGGLVFDDNTRLGYDFVGWFTDQDVEVTSDDQRLFELLGNTEAINANNVDAAGGIVPLKARWDEQSAEINYVIDDGSNGMGKVTQHVDGTVADDSGDVLSELVLKFHGNNVMGATATANPGYHFVHWLVNKPVDGSTPMNAQSVVVRAAGSEGGMVAQDIEAADNEWYVYSTNASISPAKDDTILYPEATYMAVFAQSDYTIAYDANYSGAAKISTTTPATWDTTGLLGSVATPTRKTYTFVGWFTDPAGGKQVTKSSKYNEVDLEGAVAKVDGAEVPFDTDGAVVTLYAHWNVENKDMTTLIGTGTTVEKDTTGSDDGTDVPKDKYWVPKDVQQELDDAIANAEKVMNDPNSTGEERIAAYERLQAAIDAYEAAKKPGTKSEKAEGDGGSDSDTKPSPSAAKSRSVTTPTTGDRLADAMILVGGVALISAGFILLALRARKRSRR